MFINVSILQERGSGNILTDLKEHTHRVVACSLSAENRNVLSGSWDKTILYWDIETSRPLVSNDNTGYVNS